MRGNHPVFAPLERERAEELKRIINHAAGAKEALVIDLEEETGVADSRPAELISPNEKTNALVRYRRHYHGPAGCGRAAGK